MIMELSVLDKSNSTLGVQGWSSKMKLKNIAACVY